jgi:transposase InsO family protein
VHEGLIFLGHRLILATSICREAFDNANALHSGISSTLRRLSCNFWWPKMKADIQRWVEECPSCQALRPRTSKDIATWAPATPFERVHGDWCHISGVGDVLVSVDAGTGWIEATRHPHRTSKAVVTSLTDLACRFGLPKVFVTDNGAELVSAEVNRWCLTNGVEKKETPTYHPASNGLAERSVQTIKRCMRAYKLETAHMTFDEYLQRILFHHRACCRRRNGLTPAELVFGRALRLPLSATFGFGDRVMYGTRRGVPATATTFLLPRGSNTSRILDDDSRLHFAHSNQLAPALNDQSANASENAVLGPPPTTPPRRSTRPRCPEQPRDYEDL